MYIKYMADQMEDLHLIGTDESGAYKRVYNFSRHPALGSISVRIPTRWWDEGVLTPSTIALVINDKTGMTTGMTTGKIIAEINTMQKYKAISPSLYGTVWHPQQLNKGLGSLYFDGYDTPSTDDLNYIGALPSVSTYAFIVLFMERCLNMNDCLQNVDFASGLIAFLTDLVKSYKIFYTDIKISNICCSKGYITPYKFRLLDLEPTYIFPDYGGNPIIAAHIMALLFLTELTHPANSDKRVLGQKLTSIMFNDNPQYLYVLIEEAGLHRQENYNRGQVDAFASLCWYAYNDSKTTSEYDRAQDKSGVITKVQQKLIERFNEFFTGGGGGLNKRRSNKRRSNKRRLNKRRENKRRSNKNKFKRTKRKLI
jgi:hypothetical protein